MTAAVRAPACPVCCSGTGTGTADRCRECAWELTTPLVLGEISESRRREFGAALDRARGRHDRRAALIAAGFPHNGDPLWLDRLLPLARGGDASLDDIRAELGAGPVDTAGAMADAVSATMRRLTTGPGQRVALAIMELAPDGVGVAWFARSALSLGLSRGVRFTPWRTVLAALPPDPARQRFALAGGVGTQPPDFAELDRQLTALAADQPLPAAAPDLARELVVLNRTAGWPLTGRLVSRLRERLAALTVTEVVLAGPERVLTEHGVADLLALAPLRHDVCLAVARIEGPGGAVRLETRQVFAAGTAMATTGEVTVAVRAPAVARRPVSVVTVVARPGEAPQAWQPVSFSRLGLRPGDEHTLRFTMTGPGQLTVHCGSSGAVETVPHGRLGRAWSDLLAGLPPVYDPGPPADADLVFAIELAGEQRVVERRLRLAGEIVGQLDREHPTPSAVRYGLLAFTDHAGKTGEQPVLTQHRLDSAEECLRALGKLRPAKMLTTHAAPLADALARAAGAGWRGAPCGRTLVVLGSRPPHPTKDGVERRCPRKLDWRVALNDLRATGVRLVVLWDAPPWTQPGSPDLYAPKARRAWSEISGRRPLDPNLHQADDVVARLAVLEPAPTDKPLLLPIDPEISVGGRP